MRGNPHNDYLSGTCKCENCGKSYAITELASADEVKLLFKQAINECRGMSDAVYSELIKLCYEGQTKACHLESYCRGKRFFETKSYSNALLELEKVPGYKDSDAMSEVISGSISRS